MADENAVANHYHHGKLLDSIIAGLQVSGISPEQATVDDLAGVDEFHIGGRQATEDFLSQLDLSPNHDVLDVGCGLGGSARFAASRFGCRVTGFDLTTEFVETGRTICSWVGLHDLVDLRQASALSLPVEAARFNAAYMIHVGMNIANKAELFREVGRVLMPASKFGIFDIMSIGNDPLSFPVPWAEDANTSSLATPRQYQELLELAGFEVIHFRDRHAFAIEFFEAAIRRIAESGPPPIGIHIAMGETAKAKIDNIMENLQSKRISPIELIAQKLDT